MGHSCLFEERAHVAVEFQRLSRVDSRMAVFQDGGELPAAARAHWSIGDSPHRSLDVTFREDQRLVRKDHGPQNMATQRRIPPNLLGRETTLKVGIQGQRPQAGRREDYPLKVRHGQDAIALCRASRPMPAPGRHGRGGSTPRRKASNRLRQRVIPVSAHTVLRNTYIQRCHHPVKPSHIHIFDNRCQ